MPSFVTLATIVFSAKDRRMPSQKLDPLGVVKVTPLPAKNGNKKWGKVVYLHAKKCERKSCYE